MLSAGAVAASVSTVGQVQGALAVQVKADEPSLDPVTQLNLQFRTLYGLNRQELWEATPLAALTLIGTGEIWRVEFGQVVKSYPPTAWIAKVKGVMHGVIGTQATWARLVRGKSSKAVREACVGTCRRFRRCHQECSERATGRSRSVGARGARGSA